MEKRKILGTILGILLFLCMITSITYAYFYWSSNENDRTRVNLTISKGLEGMIKYKCGIPILGSDNQSLEAVDNYQEGVSTTIEFWKNSNGANNTIYGGLSLKVLKMLSAEGTTDANIGKTETIKWAITTYNINDSTEVLLQEGTFKGSKQKDTFPLIQNFELNPYQTFYKFYLWLDRNAVDNTYSVLNELLSVEISASATDTMSHYGQNPSKVLANLGLMSDFKSEQLTTFTGTSKQDGTTGIYKTTDDLGDSYYFRGNVTNNYVKFGKNADGQDMWWRIIRINGDGSLRMIYDGTSAHANNEVSEDRYIGFSAYNVNANDNAFVGYMNGTTDGTNFPSGGTSSTSYEEAHANNTDSTIKTYLDNWYKTNIVDTGYSDKVVDAIYCNDRTRVTDTTKMAALNAAFGKGATGEGYGTYATLYGLYNRVTNDVTGVIPSLICSRTEDKFTKNSTLGNGKLTYPVGLITLDELAFGGAFLYMGEQYINDQTYLNNGIIYYWTMSPFEFSDGSARVGFGMAGAFGTFSNFGVDGSHGAVRPVISILASAITGGTGISTDPFIVSSINSSSSPALTTLTNLGLDDEINDTELTTFTAPSNQDGTTGIYKTTDDLGDSYYFRGNVVNNYVKYGKYPDGEDIWWRIIRINGDGSVRMIYDGTSAHANNEDTEDRYIIIESAYNENYGDNAFIGYMNGTTDGTNFPSGGTNSTSYEEAHANITDSTIKEWLDTWYKEVIVDAGYSDNVVDAIYCNDRTRVTDTTKMAAIDAAFGWNSGATGEGFGRHVTYYGVLNRIANDLTGVTPSLICSRQEDKFTRNSTLGNGKLTYPVGLITFDELVFGGAFLYESEEDFNDQTYLYNGGSAYWTMTPFASVSVYLTGSGMIVFGIGVGFSGAGVRPVITLSSSAINDGTGISTDPFVVQ